MTMTTENIIQKLTTLPLSEVSIGFTTIRLFSESEISDGQLGYSIDPDGNSLVGDKEGDWKENWLVIGYDETCGDPILTDFSIPQSPVYTAMHGMGDWKKVRIADSFEGFCESLAIIAKIAVGRENPVLLQKNPISSEEKRDGIGKIKTLNPESNLEFWELTLTEY